MNTSNARSVNVEEMAKWVTDENAIAVMIEEALEPVGGWDWPVKPPTFGSNDKKSPYQIDELRDGRNVCLIDSIQSNNNRREAIFLRGGYRDLVPDVRVKIGEEDKSILDLPHRVADVTIRFSSGREKISQALKSYAKGDAWPLAELAPTTLVFGAWDSRGDASKTKIPRIVSSLILAFDVSKIHAPFQYSPVVDFKTLLYGEDKPQEKLSAEGFDGALDINAGGVIVRGGIRMQTEVNLRALRALGTPMQSGKLDPVKTEQLRRYVLGLSLIAAMTPISLWLRQGCNLRRLSSSIRLITDQGNEPIVMPGLQELIEWTRTNLPSNPLKQEKIVFNAEEARNSIDKRGKGNRKQRTAGSTKTPSDSQPEGKVKEDEESDLI